MTKPDFGVALGQATSGETQHRCHRFVMTNKPTAGTATEASYFSHFSKLVAPQLSLNSLASICKRDEHGVLARRKCSLARGLRVD